VPVEFLRPSPELKAQIPRLRGGRVFTCSIEDSRSYQAVRAGRRFHHELWSFAIALETLTPSANMPLGVASALSQDRTMLVPPDRVSSPVDDSCANLNKTVQRLQRSGVRRVLSLDPLQHEALVPAAILAPDRIAPLRIHVYRLDSAAPLVEISSGASGSARVLAVERRGDELQIEAETARPGRLVVREGRAPGWSAHVDGAPVRIEPAEQHYMAVRLAQGRHAIRLRYRTPWLGTAVLLSAVAFVLVALALMGGAPRESSASDAT